MTATVVTTSAALSKKKKSCTPHLVTPHPSRLCRWRTDQRSLFSLLSFSLSFYPRALRRLTDSLAPRNASLVAGSFARPLLFCCVSAPIRYGWYCGDGAPRSLSDFPLKQEQRLFFVFWCLYCGIFYFNGSLLHLRGRG